MNNNYIPHHFHIPVMGLAYTIDSPIKVARFGIASVVSIVEDKLIEMMRKHYYPSIGKVYYPITEKEPDYRAKRITDYLNLINTIVHEQINKLRKSGFEKGSEIIKYFEMLPDNSMVKQIYLKLTATDDSENKDALENKLREYVVPGSIDVNIMTKVDRDQYDKNHCVIENGSDAVTALRGYVQSDLSHSTIIFSAGLNPRLYNYLERCDAFDADENGRFTKKVAIKVSDYRSALIQGKYLAKKGVWVSEFRIESGLNCGGHAFATDGNLMGPILEEFKSKKEELINILFELYNTALVSKGKKVFATAPHIRITAQGGIGTYEEDQFLHHYYNVESTGWGTPFLLVPEATTVDENTLQLLSKAKSANITLSYNSPLGVRFHYLKNTTSDIEKGTRIADKKPGSPCPEKMLAFNTEFTDEPICTASYKYQKLKIAQLQSLGLSEEAYQEQLQKILDKECLCIGLSNAASQVYNQEFVNKLHSVNICPGPNIVNFSKITSLQTMCDHIYGRTNLVTNEVRPHMFIAELRLYVTHFREFLKDQNHIPADGKAKKVYQEYYKNVMNGIHYYRSIKDIAADDRSTFENALYEAEIELQSIMHLLIPDTINNASLVNA